MLVLSEGKHQRVQDKAQVGDKLCARLLLKSGECTTKKKDGAHDTSVFHINMVVTFQY